MREDPPLPIRVRCVAADAAGRAALGRRVEAAGLRTADDGEICLATAGADLVQLLTTGLPVVIAVDRVDAAGLAHLRLGAVDLLTPEDDLRALLERRAEEGAARRRAAEEEERLRLAVQGADDALWDWDLRTDAVLYSRRYLEMLGLEDGDVAPHLSTWLELVHPEDLERALAAVQAVIHSGASRGETRFRLRHRDGRWIPVHARAILARAADGQPTRIVGSNRDLSAIVEAEERLRLSEERSSLALATAKLGVWEWDIAEDRAWWSEECRSLLGLAESSGTLADLAAVVHAADAPLLLAELRHALEEGSSRRIEFRVGGAADCWFAASFKAVAREGGPPRKLIGLLHDVTETRRAQEALLRAQEDLVAHQERLEEIVARRTAALAASEARLRLILESSADGLFGLDPDLRITFVNPAACAMLGRAAESIVDEPFDVVIRHTRADHSPWPEFGSPIHATLTTGAPVRRSGDLFWRADGSPFPVSFATEPMLDQGVIVGAVVSFADITAQLEADAARVAALREAERLARARSDFVANMSHEIRTPLGAVLGLAQVGLRQALGTRSRANFRRIMDAGQHLVGIIDDILDYSKIEAGKLLIEAGAVDLGAAIDRALELTAARIYQKGLELEVSEAPGLPVRFRGDELRLSQVLVNLLSNATKFTDQGRIGLSAARRGDQLVLAVEDSGIGMSVDQAEIAMRPFEQADSSSTRRVGGTGLGLSISRELVAQMEGEMRVRSQPGAGSRFEVHIPLREVVEATPGAGTVAFAAPLDPVILAEIELHGLRTLPAQVGRPPEADVLLVSEAAVSLRSTQEWLRGLCDRGLAVALLCRPGGDGAPALLRDRVVEIAEPFRVRHLAALIGGSSQAALLPESDSPRLAGLRILAAEDNDVNRLVLDELLGSEGAKMTCVENGRLAVERVRADPRGFDLVLADIQMPEMDGYEATRRIHELAPGLPVVGLTAHATTEERRRCLEAGMVEHVAKPFHHDLLVAVIRGHTKPPPIQTTLDWGPLDAQYPERPDFVRRLVRAAIEDHGGTVAGLQDAAARGDFGAIAEKAHRVRGTALNLHLDRVAEEAGRVEAAARAGSEEAVGLARGLAETTADAIAQAEARLGPS